MDSIYRGNRDHFPDIAIATAKFPISRYRDDRDLSVCLSTIKQESLSYEYVNDVRDQLCRDGAEIPEVTKLGNYKFTSTSWTSHTVSVITKDLLADDHTAELVTELCTVKGCNLGEHVRVLKLQDTTPCYSLEERAGHTHPDLIKHWYIKVGLYEGGWVKNLLSLVTHSLQEVLDAFRSASAKSYFSVSVHCLEEQQ